MSVAPESIAFLGSGTILAVNVIGWIIASNRNKDAIESAAKAAAVSASKEITKIADMVQSMGMQVDKLPCVKDSDYMVQSGRLMEKVDNLKTTQLRLEDKLDKVLGHLNGVK